jgi:hypothetical protein
MTRLRHSFRKHTMLRRCDGYGALGRMADEEDEVLPRISTCCRGRCRAGRSGICRGAIRDHYAFALLEHPKWPLRFEEEPSGLPVHLTGFS